MTECEATIFINGMPLKCKRTANHQGNHHARMVTDKVEIFYGEAKENSIDYVLYIDWKKDKRNVKKEDLQNIKEDLQNIQLEENDTSIKTIGFVGNGADKFTKQQVISVQKYISDEIQKHKDCIVVSGGSPLGGVDVWAENIAKSLGYKTDIKRPKILKWESKDGGYGFKARNLDIAKSDKLYVIVAKNYPPKYKKRKFNLCYHCAKIEFINMPKHVKSGGCWTGWKAVYNRKLVTWAIVDDDGTIDEIKVKLPKME